MSPVIVRPLGSRRRTLLWESRQAFFSDARLFILGAAGAYSLNVMGSLPGGEVLLFLYLPLLLLSRGKRAFERQYLLFYVLMLGWLLGTIVADEYNAMFALAREKGTARVVFFC